MALSETESKITFFDIKRMGSFMDNRKEWALCRDELVSVIVSLGFPGEFGDQIAKQLGSPKAIQRMIRYLCRRSEHRY